MSRHRPYIGTEVTRERTVYLNGRPSTDGFVTTVADLAAYVSALREHGATDTDTVRTDAFYYRLTATIALPGPA